MAELIVSLAGLDPPWFHNAHVKEWRRCKEMQMREFIEGRAELVIDDETRMLLRRAFNLYDA